MVKNQKNGNNVEKSNGSRPEVGPVAVAILDGLSEDEIRELLAGRYGITAKKEQAEIISIATDRINSAASVNIVTELARAKKQTEEIYKTAIDAGDTRTALSARQELSKLFNLYDGRNMAALSETIVSTQERAVRSHLEPLELTEEGLPVEELARRVALFVVNNLKPTARTSSTGGRLRKTQKRGRATTKG